MCVCMSMYVCTYDCIKTKLAPWIQKINNIWPKSSQLGLTWGLESSLVVSNPVSEVSNERRGCSGLTPTKWAFKNALWCDPVPRYELSTYQPFSR